jgi:hypothetical protein
VVGHVSVFVGVVSVHVDDPYPLCVHVPPPPPPPGCCSETACSRPTSGAVRTAVKTAMVAMRLEVMVLLP